MKDLDIKEIWKAGADDETSFGYSQQEVERLIEQGSSNLISKFIKTLRIEQAFNVVTLLAISAQMVYDGHYLVSMIILLINGMFYFYYQRLKSKLKKEYTGTTVLEYLVDTKELIRRFIRHYKIASLGLVAFCLGLAEYLKGEGFYGLEENQNLFYFSLFSGIAVAIPTTYYGIHLMYGKKANKLEQMIHSLHEEEN